MTMSTKRPFAKSLLITLAVIGFFFAAGATTSHAATKTWTNGGGTGNWNNNANWSPSGVPGSGDDVVFNSSSVASCTLDVAPNVQGFTISSGYTGTITETAGQTVTVGTDGFSETGGTFTGSSGGDAIQINGNFSVTGGTFTSTNGVLSLAGATNTFSSGFVHNSGHVIFSGVSTTISGSSTFYEVEFGAYYAHPAGIDYLFTIATGTVFTVNNTTLFDGNYSDIYFQGGGEVDDKGDLLLGSPEPDATPSSTFNFVLDGTGTQNINDQGYTNLEYDQFFELPSLTINKSSGVVNLIGNIRVNGAFNNKDGPSFISAGSSTIGFSGLSSSSTITGSSTFNNVWLGSHEYQVNTSVTIATGTAITAGNLLFLSVDSSYLQLSGGGTIYAQGNIGTGQDPYYVTSTVSVVLNGTGTQLIGDQSACQTQYFDVCGILLLPGLTIAKTTGTVTLANAIYLDGNFINTNGITINPGTSTVSFGGGDGYDTPFAPDHVNYSWAAPTSTYMINGSSTFYNLEFGELDSVNPSVNGLTITMSSGTVLTVQGYLGLLAHYTNFGYAQILGGQIDAQGDIIGQYTPVSSSQASTVAVVLDGSGNQFVGVNYNCDPVLCTGLVLPNLTVAKPAGVAYIDNNVVVQATTTVSQGELDLATSTSATSAQFSGALIVNSGARLSDYPLASSTVYTTSVTNNGVVFFDGVGLNCGNSIPSSVILRSVASSPPTVWSGSGTTFMRYVDFADQTSTPAISVWNGVNNGDTDWTATTNPDPELIQNVANNGGAGTSQIKLSAFPIYPRAGDLIAVAESVQNQALAAPTDSAGNTYTLAASSSFGSSPSYAVGIYYAKDIVTNSSFAVTLNGGGGSGEYLSGEAFDYTGITSSSTLQSSSSHNDAGTTVITSFGASGQYTNELYFGAMTFDASTTASSEAGWTSESTLGNSGASQSLYIEALSTTSVASSLAATWTAATTTRYADAIAVFNAPYLPGYSATGTLDSAIFDTGDALGAQLNSVTWQGTLPAGTHVGFQFAVGNTTSGAWTSSFIGPTGDSSQYFGYNNTSANTPTPLSYTFFSGYRYFRYRIELFANSNYSATPVVNQVTVNWSP
jgi:hypothetical protein